MVRKFLNHISFLRYAYKNWLPMTLYLTLHRLRLSGKKDYVGITKRGDRVLGNYWFLIRYANFIACDKPSISICQNVKIDCKEAKEELATKDVLPIYYNSKKILFKVAYPKLDSRYGGKAIKFLAIPDFEAFCGSYSFLDVKDSTVIDIGAYVGDSPIYFALKGAKRVIALEPNPLSYKLALENVKINQGVSDVVTILNAGYGKDGTVKVNQEYISTSMDLKSSEAGESIRIFSLKTLMSEVKADGRVVLKMDCEGCEYNLLDEDDETLRRFDQIVIEYHYGPERLVRRLESAGFKVKFTEPHYSYNPWSTNPHMQVGFIYAQTSLRD